MKGKVKLSQCMIVKNEEKNIERALSWGKEIVYEQIVVDTGSTDKTVEIAENMGAKVFHFEWRNDFSAAKNYAIEQATGNWIAFLDADEYFTPEDTQKLMKLLKDSESNQPIKEKAHFIRATLVNLDDAGRPSSTAIQDRIFRNIPSLRYQNKIHEVISLPDGMKMRCIDAREVLNIIHTGYTSDAFKGNNKAVRNIKILQEELTDNPGDYNIMSYLGDAFIVNMQYREAVNTFQEIIDNAFKNKDITPFTIDNSCGQLMKVMVRNLETDENDLNIWYQKCIDIAPKLPDIDYWYGIWMLNHERWKETFLHMQSAVDLLEQYQGMKTLNISGDLERVYCILSRSAQELNDNASAVKYMVLALRMNRFLESVLVALLDILRREPSEVKDASGTFSLIKNIYHLGDLKDKLFVLKCTKLSEFGKMEELILGLFTEEEREGLL